MAEGLRLTPDWQPECCPVCACAYDPSYMCLLDVMVTTRPPVTNFIWPYLHQFSIDSHGLNGYGKPLKRPFDRYQSRLEAISNGRDIRQINW